jgi:hypothetical protein
MVLVKFSDRADPEKSKKDLNIYDSAARFNVAEGQIAPISPLDIFYFWGQNKGP